MPLPKPLRLALPAAAIVALGGAASVWCRRTPTPDPVLPLPEYTTPSATMRAHGNDPFEIVARPASPPPPKVVAYAFGIGELEPNPIDAPIEVLPGGVVRLKGSSRALVGARQARLVVGTASSIHRFDDAVSRARSGESDSAIRVLTIAITHD